MGGSFSPLAWQLRPTVKDGFLFPVVDIDINCLCFLNIIVHEDVKSEEHLISVGDVVWLDLFFQ